MTKFYKLIDSNGYNHIVKETVVDVNFQHEKWSRDTASLIDTYPDDWEEIKDLAGYYQNLNIRNLYAGGVYFPIHPEMIFHKDYVIPNTETTILDLVELYPNSWKKMDNDFKFGK